MKMIPLNRIVQSCYRTCNHLPSLHTISVKWKIPETPRLCDVQNTMCREEEKPPPPPKQVPGYKTVKLISKRWRRRVNLTQIQPTHFTQFLCTFCDRRVFTWEFRVYRRSGSKPWHTAYLRTTLPMMLASKRRRILMGNGIRQVGLTICSYRNSI